MNDAQNPYQPASDYEAHASSIDPQTLRIAKAQKLVMYALLLGIAVNIAIYGAGPRIGSEGILALYLTNAVFSIWAAFKLAKYTISALVGVVCGILMLVPCVSLLTLFLINQRATKHLKSRGIHVGLMGANLEELQ